MTDPRVALVTGISSGIGEATAKELVESGFRVFGTVRSSNAVTAHGIEPVVLDVRDEPSIDRAVHEIVRRAGRIDAVINNAGTTISGAIEETDVEQARDLFDVNFFGAVRVTQAVLPTLRAQRSGRIVFMSSVLGFLPAPFMGFYSASKHALEGYSESLDHEVRALGIRSVLVEPGYMKTRLDTNTKPASRRIEEYDAARARVAASVSASVSAGDDPTLVAKTIALAVTTDHPRLRYQVGKNAGTLARLRSFMPSGMFDRALRKSFHVDA
jgi:NAD(P)-dependent dehydrogenase (short-subunit alcohol dehydrogenase family)